MNTLYNIQNEQKAILAEVEMNGGELTPEILERIQFVEERFDEKAQDYSFVIKQFEDTSSILDKEIKRLQAMKKVSDNNVERLKARIKEAMLQFNITEVKTPFVKLSFRKSEKVVITDETLIDAKYCRFKSEPDKTLIKEALEGGEAVLGAIIVTEQNLQMK